MGLRARDVLGLCHIRHVPGHAIFHHHRGRGVLRDLPLQCVPGPAVVDQERITKEATDGVNICCCIATDRILPDCDFDHVVIRRS